jgi:hypothetical protein
MSATFTMYGRELMLRAMLTPDAFTALGDMQVALTRTVPPANADATQLTEPTVGGYARQVYPALLAYWAPTGFGELYNTQVITFPMITVNWGLVAGWALLDPISGQCLSVGSVQEPYSTIIGMVPRLDPGTMQLGIYD